MLAIGGISDLLVERHLYELQKLVALTKLSGKVVKIDKTRENWGTERIPLTFSAMATTAHFTGGIVYACFTIDVQ